jgi:hypothetical protein
MLKSENKCKAVLAEGQGMIVDLKVYAGPRGGQVPISMGVVNLNRLPQKDLVRKWRREKELTHIYIYLKSWTLQRIEEDSANKLPLEAKADLKLNDN